MNGILVTDLEFLKQPCTPVDSLEEGEEIAKKLFQYMTENKRGVGLAANQIGMQKRVFVVNVKEPLYFINPNIIPVESDGKFVYLESCLSMPGVLSRTERWNHILLKSNNFEEFNGEFDISNINKNNIMNSMDAFEMAVIQHEYDHINGLLMTDKLYKPKPFQIHSIGRNDKVKIEKDNKIIEIKYKKIQSYINNGWSIIEKN